MNSEVGLRLTELLLAAIPVNAEDNNEMKKYCNIALELVDNAQRYSNTGNILFDLHITNESLQLRLENMASPDDAARLKEYAEAIGTLSRAEMDEAYKRQLLNPAFGYRGGAGLGILQIGRKGIDRFEVQITNVDEENWLCTCLVEKKLNNKKRP
ncbi:MAG: DUF6272 family protein [Flavobacteriales bacterium]|nr:DUF6272 family protein [Flavobacteriales bacterium]